MNCKHRQTYRKGRLPVLNCLILSHAGAAGGGKEVVEDVGIVADEYNVVVAYAVAQEIARGLVEVETHLRAAQILVRKVFLKIGRCHEVTVEFLASAFHYRHLTFRQSAAHSHATLALEVVAEHEILCLVQAYGAMGQHHLVAVGVYA